MVSPIADALSGVRVADFTETLPGPLASLLLAQMGADVIKIEPPRGDAARAFETAFTLVNGEKQSVILDLKTEAGRTGGQAIAAASDVVIEGYRPGKAEALGIGFERLAKLNERLVYCSLSGYGQDGPRRNHPGHDAAYQAAVGLLSAYQDLDAAMPIMPPLGLADVASGLLGVVAILGALVGRQDAVAPIYLDIAMLDATALVAVPLIATALGGVSAPPSAHYRPYKTRDGRQVILAIAPYEDKFWRELCDALGLGSLRALTAPARAQRQGDLTQILAAEFGKRTLAECERALRNHDIPWDLVRTPEEVLTSAAFVARRILDPVTAVFDVLRTGRTGAPRPAGSDTEQVLRTVGCPELLIEQCVEGLANIH